MLFIREHLTDKNRKRLKVNNGKNRQMLTKYYFVVMILLDKTCFMTKY